MTKRISMMMIRSAMLCLEESRSEEATAIYEELLNLLDKKYGDKDTFVVVTAIGMIINKFSKQLEPDA